MSRITFQKRQKEMKRQEKQRMKAERRAQRKLAKNTEGGVQGEIEIQDDAGIPAENAGSEEIISIPTESKQ
jgi:hypothetical protein